MKPQMRASTLFNFPAQGFQPLHEQLPSKKKKKEDIIQFSILEEGKRIFLTLLDLQSNTSQYDFFFLIIFYFMNHPNTTLFIFFLFYEPSQYDMIHDRKNQTSKSPFLLGELTSSIQLVKVYGVPNSLSHRKCL